MSYEIEWSAPALRELRKLNKPLAPHVHAHPLLQREGKRWNPVIEDARLDLELVVLEYEAGRKGRRLHVLPGKGATGRKA